MVLTSPINIFAADNTTVDNTTIERISNTITLHLGSPAAYVNNEWRDIDTTNIKVLPLLQNSRTLIPVRFIGESLGGSSNLDI